MSTINTEGITDPAIVKMLAPSNARPWNLNDLLTSYPWNHESDLKSVVLDLTNTVVTSDQDDNMLDEIARIEQRHDLAITTLNAQLGHLIVDAVIKNTWPEETSLPHPHDNLMVDLRSLANGVTQQHWRTALMEWLESEPEPDDNGIAECTMTPDDYCQMPFMIEMKSIPTAGDPDFLLIYLDAFFDIDEQAGQHVGSAVWRMHLPSYR